MQYLAAKDCVTCQLELYSAMLSCRAPVDPRRVYAVSDIHTDYDENMEWIENMESGQGCFEQDVLLVGGWVECA